MSRWRSRAAHAIFWGLWGNVWFMALLASVFPRYDLWCLLGAGVSSVLTFIWVVLAARWRWIA